MNNLTSKTLAALALIAVVCIAIALVLGTKRVSASSFTVTNLDDSGPGSLRQAIIDANANSGPDDINFQDELSGTITLTSGELLITDDLTINGPGVRAITVSGNHASRVFEITSGITVSISALTIGEGNAGTGDGGGLFNNGGTVTLADTTLSDNAGSNAGGITNNNGGTLMITNTRLSNNSTTLSGGAIRNNGGMVTISNSTLSNNFSINGGGIANNGGTLTLTNCTLSGNSAGPGDGGGIVIDSGTANISLTTLSSNSAASGGGINNFGTVNIKNSIVANSTSGGDCVNSGTWNATGVNFTTQGTCPGFTQVTSAQLNLGPLADNGGPTQTHALLPGSVAIDAAPDCTDLASNTVTTDQRGVSRPQGTACDVGSYEFMPCSVPPTIRCPESSSVSTDPNQCTAVVQFNPRADCSCPGEPCSVSCSPPSGSTFPKGTTTVTCTATDSFGNISQPCSFTVTVNDSQPPTITCPANVNSVTPVPGGSSAVVTFPQPAVSDNCPGVTSSCNPPSGSTFPVGCTVVTCTATDTSGNTAACNFNVCVFSICLQDDSNPNNVILINTATGDYRFCCNGTTFTGRGKMTIQGSTFTLEHNAVDRRVRASATGSSKTGNASLQSPPGRLKCNITDSNTSNNTNCTTCQ